MGGGGLCVCVHACTHAYVPMHQAPNSNAPSGQLLGPLWLVPCYDWPCLHTNRYTPISATNPTPHTHRPSSLILSFLSFICYPWLMSVFFDLYMQNVMFMSLWVRHYWEMCQKLCSRHMKPCWLVFSIPSSTDHLEGRLLHCHARWWLAKTAVFINQSNQASLFFLTIIIIIRSLRTWLQASFGSLVLVHGVW